MRNQASIEAMFAITLVILLTALLLSTFLGQGTQVRMFEESYGAEQVCFTIRNILSSISNNGTHATIDIQVWLNGPYTLEFIESDLNIKTERGFICTLPAPVYNSTNHTHFEIGPGALVFINLDGHVYLQAPPPDTQPPVITNVHHLPPIPMTGDTVYVLWETNENSNSTVTYRVDAGAWNSITAPAYVQYHSLSLGQFPAHKTVQYYVTSCDALDNCATNNNAGAYYAFTVTAPWLSDYGTWRLSFDPASDFNYKARGSWTIKTWLYDQTMNPTAGKTLRLTITRINDGAVSVNNQLMTDNGDGSYQYTATIPNPWNNDWAQIRILYDDPNNNLDMNYYRVVYVSGSPGASDRPWKLEPDLIINNPYAYVNNSYPIRVWLYNAGNATMPGQDVRITVQSENGPVLINNQTMMNNGDGTYQYTIAPGTLTNATDYRIQTWVNKTISSRQYLAQHEYTVEGTV